MALQRFVRRVAEAANGTGEAKDALAQMGIALRDQSGNLRRSEDLLADVADAFARIEDPAERVRLAFKLFDSEGVALGMFIPGTHGNGALMAQVVLTRAVSFADDFAGARAYAGVSATAETVLDVHRNGSPIGTITFGTGASAGTFATAGGGAETFAAGDRLAIINEDPADATLADLSITFLGKRT